MADHLLKDDRVTDTDAKAKPVDSQNAVPRRDNASDSRSFAALIRERTQAIHREAERSGYIADLLRGKASSAGYAVYLANLLPAYEAMERHIGAHHRCSALQAFAAPGLARAQALRADLAALASASLQPPAVLPEGLAYAAAVDRAAQGDGVALVAHAYARYLGDLSGGQILKPLLARTLALKPEQLTFYDFPDVADIASCKAALRQALDTIAPGSEAAAVICDEAVVAFRHTIAVATAVSEAMREG